MNKLEDIVSLCKRRGFIFQGSDIYGGMAGTWDFGPLGVILKKNLTDAWWKYFVENRSELSSFFILSFVIKANLILL